MVKIHFTKKNTLISKLVRILSCTEYSHVEIDVADVCYSAKPFRGVYKQYKRDLLDDNNVIETWFVDDRGIKTEKLVEFLEEQVGKKYDYLPVFALGFLRQNWRQNSNKWFCSELVDQAMRIANVPLSNKFIDSSKLTISQLRSSPVLICKDLRKNPVSKSLVSQIIGRIF